MPVFPKIRWLLGFTDPPGITGNPYPFDATQFDIPSRGPDFPTPTATTPRVGDVHFDTVDDVYYMWNGTLWVGQQAIERNFNDAGVGLNGGQPMHRAGGSGNMVKAYVNSTHVAIMQVAIITPQAGHGGFDVKVGTLQTATFFTDDFQLLSVPAGQQFTQYVNINKVLKNTDLGDAPDSGALSAQLANVVPTNPDDVTVDVILRQTPDPARL